MRQSPEYHLTVAVAQYLNHALPAGALFSHFPAGEVRDERTAAKLKHMGTKPGWPDFVLVLPGGRFGGIELKAPGGYLSPSQRAFQEACEANGALYAVARSLAEVEGILSAWLSGTGVKLKARAS